MLSISKEGITVMLRQPDEKKTALETAEKNLEYHRNEMNKIDDELIELEKSSAALRQTFKKNSVRKWPISNYSPAIISSNYSDLLTKYHNQAKAAEKSDKLVRNLKYSETISELFYKKYKIKTSFRFIEGSLKLMDRPNRTVLTLLPAIEEMNRKNTQFCDYCVNLSSFLVGSSYPGTYFYEKHTTSMIEIGFSHRQIKAIIEDLKKPLNKAEEKIMDPRLQCEENNKEMVERPSSAFQLR